jgi:hypothetical protein
MKIWNCNVVVYICNKHITKMLRCIHAYEWKWYFGSIVKAQIFCLAEQIPFTCREMLWLYLLIWELIGRFL